MLLNTKKHPHFLSGSVQHWFLPMTFVLRKKLVEERVPAHYNKLCFSLREKTCGWWDIRLEALRSLQVLIESGPTYCPYHYSVVTPFSL